MIYCIKTNYCSKESYWSSVNYTYIDFMYKLTLRLRTVYSLHTNKTLSFDSDVILRHFLTTPFKL